MKSYLLLQYSIEKYVALHLLSGSWKKVGSLASYVATVGFVRGPS
jgi:hypothetical protein